MVHIFLHDTLCLILGHVIAPGGLLLLGQDQDSVGGGFDAHQRFVGEMTGVNIWNHVMTSQEIFNMSISCLAGEGNVVSWSNLRFRIQGNVSKVPLASCYP